MASYHLAVHDRISRGNGQSIVRTAAYNARTKLTDERTGETWDYSHLEGHLWGGNYVQKDAPDWSRDLQKLVNEIERVEKRSDSQLAVNLDIALPHELTLEQNQRLAQDFVREQFMRQGYAARVDIHVPDKDGDDRNIHMHVWASLRKIGPEGFAATKKEQQDNFKNRDAYVEEMRERWERLANRHLERAGVDARIDRRSLQERGIDREPDQHKGPAVTAMQRRGEVTRIGDEIAHRQKRNAEPSKVTVLEAEERALTAQIIDLKSEREARYGPLQETQREVGKEQFSPKYNELRAAVQPPEIEQTFAASAARATEPIPEPPPAPVERPLGQTAGEIRLAWTLSRSQEELETALAARCITLAQATAQEAETSQRVSAFAHEIGNFAPAMKEGEIVAVDHRGTVYRLTERTTGDSPAEIEKRLGLIDGDSLLSVADAKDAMREASFEAWKTERQAERERIRPATALEGRIIECAEHARLYGVHVQKNDQGEILLGAAALAYRMQDERTGEAEIVHGHNAFAARLHDAGIAIVRVTSSDVPALDALRQSEAMARLAAETNGEARKQHHFAELLMGDLAAVTRSGDVHRISADKLHGVELPAELPSMTDARGAFEAERTDTATHWELKRAEIAAEREAFAEGQELRAATATAEGTVHKVFSVSAAAIDKALDVASGIVGSVANVVSGFIGGLSSFFGDSEPKLTRQQVREVLQARGNEETLQARDYAAKVDAREAEFEDHIHAVKTGRQQEDLSFSQRYGTPPTREANPDRPRERDDDYGRKRER